MGRVGYMEEIELRNLIQNGENSFVEFKSSDPNLRPDSFAKEIVAFLNHEGGTILLGVEDDKTITGIQQEKAEEWVMNIARNLVSPPVIPSYAEMTIEGCRVGIVTIREGRDKPYSVSHSEKETSYIRVGSTSRQVSREEMRRLYQFSTQIHYDTVPVSVTKSDDLDFRKLKEYFRNNDITEIDSLTESEFLRYLKNAQFLAGDNATVAGVLLFGVNPNRCLSQSGVTFASFKGEDISELLDRQELEGTLAENVEMVRKIVQRHTSHPSTIEGMIRKEEVVYPDSVVREGIVNALIHRDYTIAGAKVMVFLYTNRLEIKSPGRLPNSVTVEAMQVGTSVSRNPVLVRVMQGMRYMDRLGRGVPLIFREMEKASGKKPEIKVEGGNVTLTLYAKDA